MRRSSFIITCAAFVAVALVAGLAQAKPYLELVPFDTITQGTTAAAVGSHAIDGHTAYFQIAQGSPASPGITKVWSNLNGTQMQSVLLDTGTWSAAAGSTSMTAFYGFGLYGDYLQFGETSSDAIWRVDTGSGALTPYVTKPQIMAHTGLTGASLLTPATSDLMGEYIFYEGSSDSILRTTGSGTLETLVADLELSAAFGNDRISGGMGMDALGNLYWGNSTSDELHGRTAGGTLHVVLSTSAITDVTGKTSASFSDVFPAPDNMVYFYEGSSDSILQFNPADPAGTLAFHTTEDELVAGPAGSDSVSTLGWYNGDLTWTKITPDSSGLYNSIVPEPATILLLAGGMLLVGLRRTRR